LTGSFSKLLLETIILSPGHKIGELTVLKNAGWRKNGKNKLRVLMLECDCGRSVLRTVQYLKQVIRGNIHHTPMCNECRDEYLRGLNLSKKFYKRERLIQFWAEYGTLYGDYWNELEQNNLKNEFEKAGMYFSKRKPKIPVFIDIDQQAKLDHYSYRRFYPISTEYGFVCPQCHALFKDGLGCLKCTEALCFACVPEHKCNDIKYDTEQALFGIEEDGETLANIGTRLRLSPERVRGIEAKALRKLRHPVRQRFLREFIQSNDYMHCNPMVRRAETLEQWAEWQNNKIHKILYIEKEKLTEPIQEKEKTKVKKVKKVSPVMEHIFDNSFYSIFECLPYRELLEITMDLIAEILFE